MYMCVYVCYKHQNTYKFRIVITHNGMPAQATDTHSCISMYFPALSTKRTGHNATAIAMNLSSIYLSVCIHGTKRSQAWWETDSFGQKI